MWLNTFYEGYPCFGTLPFHMVSVCRIQFVHDTSDLHTLITINISINNSWVTIKDVYEVTDKFNKIYDILTDLYFMINNNFKDYKYRHRKCRYFTDTGHTMWSIQEDTWPSWNVKPYKNQPHRRTFHSPK